MKKITVFIFGCCLVSTMAAWGDFAEEKLALAKRTLEYVAKSVDAETLKPYADELAADEKWLKGETLPGYREGIGREIAKLRRRILFLHPDLQFDKLLCVQRGIPYHHDPHEVDQYVGRYSRPGPGLITLENWKTIPYKKEILKGKVPTGTVINPDLHWDGDRVLFAFCDHTTPSLPSKIQKMIHCDIRARTPWMNAADPTSPFCVLTNGERAVAHHRYFIYEAAADGSWVRQITGTPQDPMETLDGRQTVMIEDIDPCYLPDGGFAFTSTRGQNFGRCHWGRWTPSFLLYRGMLPPVGDFTSGVKDIRMLSFGEANEWEPMVLDDGRIGYTRWDYINRNAVWHQSLWAIRPDGTGVSHIYGNYSEDVCVATEMKTIPRSRLLVATAAAHHNITAGSLFLLDTTKGEDGLEPLTRLTPESPFPEVDKKWKLGGTFCCPMPVNDTLFFCAYSDEPISFPKGHPRARPHTCGAEWPSQAAYGIYLIDRLGGRELIFKDPTISTFNPIPITPRKRPPVLASVLPPPETAPTTGVFYVENVYKSRRDLPPGSVKALRINRIINLPICNRRTTLAGTDLDLYKESLGTVPVEADGSAAFRVPACVPLQLQAIDTNGMAILTMRSFIISQKGEIQGCVGCHENRSQVAAVKVAENTLARKGVIHNPVKEIDLGYSGPFSFARSIQPIFDNKCISCHGLSNKAPFSLIGIGEAVPNLLNRKQVAYLHAYRETHYSKPYDYFAGASALTKKLKAGHGPALTDDEWKKLILWMDFSVPYCARSAGYGWNGPDSREIDEAGEKALRAAIKERLGAKVAAEPFDALVNRGDEKLSRILNLIGGEKAVDYARFLTLCQKSLKPMLYHDIAGTCGRDENCQCRSCWVRVGGLNKPGINHHSNHQELDYATPESQGVSSRAILNWIDAYEKMFDGADSLSTNAPATGSMHGFVIMRHGKVIAEGSWKPFNTLTETHMLYSHSKSFTSTAIGLLVDDGKLDLDERILSIFPETKVTNLTDYVKQLRVRDLLTMNVGAPNPDPEKREPSGEWVSLFLNNAITTPPGTHFKYDSAATYMLAAIVEKRAGRPLMDFLRERLFNPIGIGKNVWTTHSPQGIACGGWGMNMTTRDQARFGQLYLQRGLWNGKRIISSDWVDLATTRQTWTAGAKGAHTDQDWQQGYCFQFWRCTHGAYRADGAAGQFTIVIPEYDAVISLNAAVTKTLDEVKLVWKYLLPAFKDVPLAPSAEANVLKKRCAELAIAPVKGSFRPWAYLGKKIALAKNARGISAVTFDRVADGTWVCSLETRAGLQKFPISCGAWAKGKLKIDTESYEKLGALIGEQPVAASGGVDENGTFRMKAFLTGTTAYIAFEVAPDGTTKGRIFAMAGCLLKSAP